MEAFARPAWRVVAYFAINCKRSRRLAFGVFVLGGGARRKASAARCSAAKAASIALCAAMRALRAACEMPSVRSSESARGAAALRTGSAMNNS